MPLTPVAPTYLSGYTGKFVVDPGGLNASLPVMSWTAKHKVATWDATNTTTGGASFPERGIESLDGSCDVIWKVTSGAPPILVGVVYALSLGVNATEAFTFNALITEIDVKMDVKGGVTYTLSFVSQGAITVAT